MTIDWTKDSEYIRLFGKPDDKKKIARTKGKEKPRLAPHPPMSPFCDNN